jgi:hypothetical protein
MKKCLSKTWNNSTKPDLRKASPRSKDVVVKQKLTVCRMHGSIPAALIRPQALSFPRLSTRCSHGIWLLKYATHISKTWRLAMTLTKLTRAPQSLSYILSAQAPQVYKKHASLFFCVLTWYREKERQFLSELGSACLSPERRNGKLGILDLLYPESQER